MAPRATGKARKQPEGPPEEVEIAGEAIERRLWRRGPKRRRSSTQKIKNSHGHGCQNDQWRPPAAVPMAGKSRTTTKSPLERHVHCEEAPKPINLQPKKRMNQNSHPQLRGGKPQRRQRQQGLEQAGKVTSGAGARWKTQPLRTGPQQKKTSELKDEAKKKN